MSDPLVIDLAEVGLADHAIVGGKASGLGELRCAGLPVPRGFCVTTTAYRRFAAHNEVIAASELADFNQTDSLQFERILEHRRAVFVTKPIPADVEDAIRDAHALLGEQPLAVRSSATLEDLAEASFAGQQDTFLNVIGLDAVLEAIRRCWASLWTSRAVAYRQRTRLGRSDVAMAVVVQVLVPADTAGVLFTANPSTGRRDEIVVNASFGLGEAVVSGLVTPDTYVIDKNTLALKVVQLGSKAVTIVPAAGGGTRAMAFESRNGKRALSDRQLHELAQLGMRAEAHFSGIPQDVEWACTGDHCVLLQSRPITALPPPVLDSVRWDPPEAGSVWIRRQVAENLPEPLSPLFEELYLREGLERSLNALMAFFNMPWFHMEDVVDRPFFATVNGFAYQRATVKFRWQTLPTVLRATMAGWRVMFREAVSFWRDRALPSYLGTVERWRTTEHEKLSDDELLNGVRELAWADSTYWFACAVVVADAKLTDALLDRFLAFAAPRRGLTSGLFLRGFASPSLTAQTELEALAEEIRRSGTLRALAAATPAEQLRRVLADVPEGVPAVARLDAYLDRYGHQIYNLDFAAPTQADEPLPVLLSLKALVEQPGRASSDRRQAIVDQRTRLVEATARSFGPVRRRLFRTLLRWAEQFGPHREEALFYMGAGWPTLRRLALELGNRAVAAGSLHSPGDVFYLESTEISAALDPQAADDVRRRCAKLARERSALRDARRRLRPPAAVPPARGLRFGPLNLSGFETQRRNTASDHLLRGFAVSPGRVIAHASVIISPSDFAHMRPGTILVCPTTTPAWTPLFSQARGLVTDVGGILAHGSIVAREYGIPAVMGVGDATQRITPDQLIAVDGDRGEVELSP